MEEYVNQVIETSQKLSRSGLKLEWTLIGSLLLAGLPERFAPMVMGIEHSGIDVTIDSIKTKLDFAADGSSQQSTSGSAFAGSSGNTGKFYRNEVDRRHQHPSPSSRGNENIKKNVLCYKCKSVVIVYPSVLHAVLIKEKAVTTPKVHLMWRF